MAKRISNERLEMFARSRHSGVTVFLNELYGGKASFQGLISALSTWLKAGKDICKLHQALMESKWKNCFAETFHYVPENNYLSPEKELSPELSLALKSNSPFPFEQVFLKSGKKVAKSLVEVLRWKNAWSILCHLLKKHSRKMCACITAWEMLLVLASQYGRVTVGKGLPEVKRILDENDPERSGLESAFADCVWLKEAVLLPEIKETAESAFRGCYWLTSVSIPETVTKIGADSFAFCTQLTSIDIPKAVTIIDHDAFKCCTGLTSIVIPDGVTELGVRAFADCIALTSMVIPDSVTTIGYAAFFACRELASIIIPDSVTFIDDMVFCECSKLSKIIHGHTLLCWNDAKGEIVVPNGITRILGGAFSSCDGLVSVTIPEGVTEIRRSTFSTCSRLAKVILPDTMTYIGEYAFYECTSLKRIIIPGSVTEIDEGAFRECVKLTRIVIPDSVEVIGEAAFKDCPRLAKVILPKEIAIAEDSFDDNTTVEYR